MCGALWHSKYDNGHTGSYVMCQMGISLPLRLSLSAIIKMQCDTHFKISLKYRVLFMNLSTYSSIGLFMCSTAQGYIDLD